MTVQAWEERADVAERLARVAVQLAARIRVDPPGRIHAWLRRQVPPGEWLAFAVVLAAHVPIGATSADLLSWMGAPSRQYLGDHRKYERLRKSGVRRSDMPAALVRGEQLYQSAIRRERRELAA